MSTASPLAAFRKPPGWPSAIGSRPTGIDAGLLLLLLLLGRQLALELLVLEPQLIGLRCRL